jgi:hypothetical protein
MCGEAEVRKATRIESKRDIVACITCHKCSTLLNKAKGMVWCGWKGVPQSGELVSQNGNLAPSNCLPPELYMMSATIRFPSRGQLDTEDKIKENK